MKTIKIKSSLNSLANLRRRLGLSQAKMAAYLQVNVSTLKLAELGDRTLPTGILVKVARVEIMLNGKPPQLIEEAVHPAEEVYSEAFVSSFEQIFEGRYKFEYAITLLERKLKIMAGVYKKTREKMQILETLLPLAGDDNEQTGYLQQQYELDKCTLKKCGIAAQALIKCRIALLNNQLKTRDLIKQQCKEELPAFLFTDTAKNTTSS